MATNENNSQAHPVRPQAAYLIRCWREGNTWRYSVEDVALRHRQRYDSLEELLEALRTRMLDLAAGELPDEGSDEI